MKILVNKSKNEYKYYCDICNKEISFEDKTRHTLSDKFEKNKSEKFCDLCSECFKVFERKIKKGANVK